MEALAEIISKGCSSTPDVPGRFSSMDKPYHFALVLTIWLLLLLYTCKRQFDCYKQSRQIVSIKDVQLEIRKNLKREQRISDLVTQLLRARMVQIKSSSCKKMAQLTDLHSLQQDINNQLDKLDTVLNFD